MRLVEPEILDELPAEDAEARQSRSDLVRVNSLMGHAGLIRAHLNSRIARIIDLGAGDGTLLLKAMRGARISEVILVDRQRVITEATLGVFKKSCIAPTVIISDVFEWLKQPGEAEGTAIVANLFLHHFKPPELKELLRLSAGRCELFIACEPRRGRWPAFAALLLGLIGCNRVTRHDARVSVRAGFRGNELGPLWPEGPWQILERKAGLFSHLFVAQRERTVRGRIDQV